MKLYYHPASTTSRPVVLFAAEQKVPLDLQVVDLFTGEHYQAPYEAINPSHLVPVLEDGDFRLTESSAILKYLADKTGSPLYPKDLQARARVNERMDWVNTQLCRDFAYGTVYPQIFSFHKRRSDEAQSAQLQWGCERAQGWLKVLDQSLLGPSNPYLCGKDMTIADYFAAAFVSLAGTIGSNLAAYPNVRAWLGRMQALPNWGAVNEAIDGYAATLDRTAMVPV
jgi:glutathione S-transferase